MTASAQAITPAVVSHQLDPPACQRVRAALGLVVRPFDDRRRDRPKAATRAPRPPHDLANPDARLVPANRRLTGM
jgi:hypothetical protein